MPDISQKRLRRTTFIYWSLLIYIIAALVWWYISLSQQLLMMRNFEVSQLHSTVNSAANPVAYQEELFKINKKYNRDKSKYLGEGSIFFLVIIIGAVFVYRSVRRQFYLQQQQQNFMMAVTHELKTPISITKLNLETLQKYNLDPEKQKKIIRTTLDETARLDFLANNILISSQLEGKRYKSSKEELDLSSLMKDCIHDFRNRFPERIIIEEIEEDADVKGDAFLLQIMINNLLENALKYSPRESPIFAGLKKQGPEIIMNIKDEGKGIPDDEKKNIFLKFYRIGNEATRKAQGTGLGLYLCREIALDHNADILMTDNKPSGSNFTVIFHT